MTSSINQCISASAYIELIRGHPEQLPVSNLTTYNQAVQRRLVWAQKQVSSAKPEETNWPFPTADYYLTFTCREVHACQELPTQ